MEIDNESQQWDAARDDLANAYTLDFLITKARLKYRYHLYNEED